LWCEADTELDTMLKARGITTLIFTGGTASICVESTLRDAAIRDYRCVLLADCTAELVGNRLPRTNHEATLMLVELSMGGWPNPMRALVVGPVGGRVTPPPPGRNPACGFPAPGSPEQIGRVCES
jgi:ureidoacrylate peracid hydrolase